MIERNDSSLKTLGRLYGGISVFLGVAIGFGIAEARDLDIPSWIKTPAIVMAAPVALYEIVEGTFDIVMGTHHFMRPQRWIDMSESNDNYYVTSSPVFSRRRLLSFITRRSNLPI